MIHDGWIALTIAAVAEVAATLGLSIANAKSRVHRARLFLRQRLAVSLQ